MNPVEMVESNYRNSLLFPCYSVNRECSWNKIQIEKEKKKNLHLLSVCKFCLQYRLVFLRYMTCSNVNYNRFYTGILWSFLLNRICSLHLTLLIHLLMDPWVCFSSQLAVAEWFIIFDYEQLKLFQRWIADFRCPKNRI